MLLWSVCNTPWAVDLPPSIFDHDDDRHRLLSPAHRIYFSGDNLFWGLSAAVSRLKLFMPRRIYVNSTTLRRRDEAAIFQRNRCCRCGGKPVWASGVKSLTTLPCPVAFRCPDNRHCVRPGTDVKRNADYPTQAITCYSSAASDVRAVSGAPG